MIIELFCTKIGLNIGGYCISQMQSMNKYERLLIELGETNYRTAAVEIAAQSSWPVEIRLFFMALVNAVTFIIIKMLANYIGETTATTIVNGLTSYLSGTPPNPGQVLFGGPTTSSTNNAIPGGAPVPQTSGPFGGLDVASLLGNLGSMFIRGQAPTTTAAIHPAPIAQTATAAPIPSATSRFLPIYAE